MSTGRRQCVARKVAAVLCTWSTSTWLGTRTLVTNTCHPPSQASSNPLSSDPTTDIRRRVRAPACCCCWCCCSVAEACCCKASAAGPCCCEGPAAGSTAGCSTSAPAGEVEAADLLPCTYWTTKRGTNRKGGTQAYKQTNRSKHSTIYDDTTGFMLPAQFQQPKTVLSFPWLTWGEDLNACGLSKSFYISISAQWFLPLLGSNLMSSKPSLSCFGVHITESTWLGQKNLVRTEKGRQAGSLNFLYIYPLASKIKKKHISTSTHSLPFLAFPPSFLVRHTGPFLVT